MSAWRESALCSELDPDYVDAVFFPREEGTLWRQHQGRVPREDLERARIRVYDEAIGICFRCPVRLECLAQAMRLESTPGQGPRSGVWGGVDPIGRDRIASNERGRAREKAERAAERLGVEA